MFQAKSETNLKKNLIHPFITGHKSATCCFIEATCHFCGNVGHLTVVFNTMKKSKAQCKKKKPQPLPVMAVEQKDTEDYSL